MELSLLRAAEIQAVGKPVLLLRLPGHERVVPLAKERVTFGSDPSSDIVLHALGVAPRHGFIHRADGIWEIFSLDTARAVRIDGSTIEASELRNGATIQIGSIHAHFLDPTADVLPEGCQLLSMPIDRASVEAAKAAEKRRLSALARHEDSFADVLMKSLQRTLWLLVSAALHLGIWLYASQFLDENVEVQIVPPNIDYDTVDTEDVEFSDEITEPTIDDDTIDEDIDMAEVRQDDLDSLDTVTNAASSVDDAVEAPPTSLLGIGDMQFGDADGNSGLRRGNGVLRSGVGDAVRRAVGKVRSSGLDLVFVIDATGSMDAEIEAARQRIAGMIALIDSFDVPFRIGIVAFRDEGDEFVTRAEPLTGHGYKAVAFLDGLRASGGGDTPEAVMAGVHEATSMKFGSKAKRVIVVVGDAPGHTDENSKLKRLAGSFARRGGRIHTLFTQGRNPFFDKRGARAFFADLAEQGGGKALDLHGDDQLVEDIMLLALEIDDRDELHRLQAAIMGTVPARAVGRRLEGKDAGFVRRQLSAKRCEPTLPLQLLKHNDRGYLGALIAVLRDAKVPIGNRWLATVLMRRLAVHINRYEALPEGLLERILSFDPEGPTARQRGDLDHITQSLYDVGLLRDEDLAQGGR